MLVTHPLNILRRSGHQNPNWNWPKSRSGNPSRLIFFLPSPITRVTKNFSRSSHRFFLANRRTLHSCVALFAQLAFRGPFSAAQCCSRLRRYSLAPLLRLTHRGACTATPRRQAATANAIRDAPVLAAPASAIPQDAHPAGVPTLVPSPGCVSLPTVLAPDHACPTRRVPNAPATSSLSLLRIFLNGPRWPPRVKLVPAARFPARDSS